jgi:2-oxoglutarate ferredoxin oxidoreductase subunit beta
MIYGLTKGQASPTTSIGMKTSLQFYGVINEPFNPIAAAISLGASFVGRAFSGDKEQTKEIIKKAIRHRGYALIDIFQPCVTFNRINNYKWFKEHTYYIDSGYDPADKFEAYKKAMETGKFPLGVIYLNKKKTFEELLPVYETDRTPVYRRERDIKKVRDIIELRK